MDTIHASHVHTDMNCTMRTVLSLLLYETNANESSHICPFLAVRAQFDSDHHQHRRLASHSYSH